MRTVTSTQSLGGIMTTSELISLPVISVHEKKVVGILTNVFVNDRNKIVCVEIVDESDYTSYILNTSDIFRYGTKAVLIRNSTVLHLLSSMELHLQSLHCPIGVLAYTIDGNIVEKITNLQFDTKYYVTRYCSAKYEFESKKCLLGKEIITIGINSKVCVSKFKPKNINLINGTDSRIVSIEKIPIQLPQREVTNYSFLIGRYTTKDILNFNGEIIVKQNTKINTFVLDKAKHFGKLKELTAFSKTE